MFKIEASKFYRARSNRRFEFRAKAADWFSKPCRVFPLTETVNICRIRQMSTIFQILTDMKTFTCVLFNASNILIDVTSSQ